MCSLTTFKKPDEQKLKELAEKESLKLSIDEIHGVDQFFDDMSNAVETVEKIYAKEEQIEKSREMRDPGYRPESKEDPYNAFIRKFFVKGFEKGPLKGKRVGIKDNINVAEIPTTNASALSQDYVPNDDATIVTRLLEAGADIVGKLNMDNLSYSGTSETSIFGSVRNPINQEYSPGGSSSGAGAAVAAGLVDIAIGVDQGGSARVPACCVGVVSIKPTHGLVPTYGLTYMDHTLDHICPVARNVEDAALALEAIAGYDQKDPQWKNGILPKSRSYSKELEGNQDAKGIKIGVIKESITWEQIDPEIKECFLSAIEKLRQLGSIVNEVSIPTFQSSGAVWLTLLVQSTHAMFDSCGEGYWHEGRYNPEWNRHIGKARMELAHQFPPLLKCAMIAGRYLREEYFSEFHSKAQNLRNLLKSEIDHGFARFDVMATPTMIVKPPKLEENITFAKSLKRGVLLLNNTIAFNLSGHPAITIPCGLRGDLPVGLQLIGKNFDESALFKVAKAFETAFNWKLC